jgi:hypothetical protein
LTVADRRADETRASNYGGLLRATCKWIAESVGFRFRTVFRGWKPKRETAGREEDAENLGKFERGRAGTGSVFPGVF